MVGRVFWSDDTVWLDAAATKKGQPATRGTIGFEGVQEAVWNFRIGGYQVCEKWLKDRTGRILSEDEIVHYQKIVVAISETICLMQEIDEVIERFGGWPNAFAQGQSETSEVVTEDNVLPLRRLGVSAFTEGASLPLQKVAEPQASQYEAATENEPASTGLDAERVDPEDVVCQIRQVLGDGEERERGALVDALIQQLGHPKGRNRFREAIERALGVAIARGIIANESGALRLSARQIHQYERNLLKEQFLASLSGKPWIERDDAIRAFARWMGFAAPGELSKRPRAQ
jgi:hypothetical protein